MGGKLKKIPHESAGGRRLSMLSSAALPTQHFNTMRRTGLFNYYFCKATSAALLHQAAFTCTALTITTFNILSPIHKSVDASHRESEREDLWRPRMEGVAGYIADTFVSTWIDRGDCLSLCTSLQVDEF
jgi:hypothetical protein